MFNGSPQIIPLQRMLAAALYILGIAHKPDESITVRSFTLLTSNGENVFHDDFDRRRLADNSDSSLALKFHAVEQQFEFKFQRSHSIFAPGSTVEITGNVRERTTYVNTCA